MGKRGGFRRDGGGRPEGREQRHKGSEEESRVAVGEQGLQTVGAEHANTRRQRQRQSRCESPAWPGQTACRAGCEAEGSPCGGSDLRTVLGTWLHCEWGGGRWRASGTGVE